MEEIKPSERPVVLFDFDGTVADSGRGVKRIARMVLERFCVPVPDDDVMNLMVGPPLEEAFRLIGARDEAEARLWTAEYRRLFDEYLTPADYPVFPGMHELLNELRARGRRLAIATSRMEGVAGRMADELGLVQFDAICGRVEGLRRTKAESIAAALDALGAAAEEAVMVGDRHYDVEGAREVGVPCIGFYSGGALPGEFDDAGAVCAVHSVAGLARVLLGA